MSPVYPIIGYTIAAGTGTFRQLNDAHWLSDVLVGAGIGYLSTDLAYAIMDEVFGEKGTNPIPNSSHAARTLASGSRVQSEYSD